MATNKVTVLEVLGVEDTSMKAQDGSEISGKIVTCKVSMDGKKFTIPVTAFGKLADRILPDVILNVTGRTSPKGQKQYNAKKSDNMHLLPDAKPWTGGNGGGGGKVSGGGMSEADILFIAACCLCGGDPAAYPQAMEEAKALRALDTATPFDKPAGSASDDTEDAPF
jgi:hypothetical protein